MKTFQLLPLKNHTSEDTQILINPATAQLRGIPDQQRIQIALGQSITTATSVVSDHINPDEIGLSPALLDTLHLDSSLLPLIRFQMIHQDGVLQFGPIIGILSTRKH